MKLGEGSRCNNKPPESPRFGGKAGRRGSMTLQSIVAARSTDPKPNRKERATGQPRVIPAWAANEGEIERARPPYTSPTEGHNERDDMMLTREQIESIRNDLKQDVVDHANCDALCDLALRGLEAEEAAPAKEETQRCAACGISWLNHDAIVNGQPHPFQPQPKAPCPECECDPDDGHITDEVCPACNPPRHRRKTPMPSDSFDRKHDRLMNELRAEHEEGFHADWPVHDCPKCEEEENAE